MAASTALDSVLCTSMGGVYISALCDPQTAEVQYVGNSGDAGEIQRRAKEGEKRTNIALAFGVDSSHVNRVIHGGSNTTPIRRAVQ